MRLALVVGAGAALFGLSAPALAQSAPPPSIFDVVEEIIARVYEPTLEHLYDGEKTGYEAADLVNVEEEESSQEFRCKFLQVINATHTLCQRR
ncbi:MAG: hypothetical protein IT535_08240 [Bauldia sp.]|nr:hypothetical protein [Bauldia sp.]